MSCCAETPTRTTTVKRRGTFYLLPLCIIRRGMHNLVPTNLFRIAITTLVLPVLVLLAFTTPLVIVPALRNVARTTRTSQGSQWTRTLLIGKRSSSRILSLVPDSSTSSATKSTDAFSSIAVTRQHLLDNDRLHHSINTGRVYQQHDFLSEEQVRCLLSDIQQLQKLGAFVKSGLTDTTQGKSQRFGPNDRSLCVVPWWGNLIQQKFDQIGNNNISKNNDDYSELLRSVSLKLHQLRVELAAILHRPGILLDLPHECYYSVSSRGSYLPRHLDERHEELKGAKGWLLPSRRSLTWLVYLSDEGWTLDYHGGALRTYPQKQTTVPSQTKTTSHRGEATVQHCGNLQVGWIIPSENEPVGSELRILNEKVIGSRAVFLNSWYIPSMPSLSSKQQRPQEINISSSNEPHCILYQVLDNGHIQVITRPWLSSQIPPGVTVADYIRSFALSDGMGDVINSLFLSQKWARSFSLLEDRTDWESGGTPRGAITVDLCPDRGSLVVFDSVLVPHQVEPILVNGSRVALAGWFHEPAQPFPSEWDFSFGK